MGYGVVSVCPNTITQIGSGVLSSSKKSLGERVFELDQKLQNIFQKYNPDHLAIEKVFLGKNPKSSFILGQAFSIAVLNAYKNSCKVFEYETRVIKKSVAGTGSASKESVSTMVKNILKIENLISLDQSDALASALCHAYSCQTQYLQSPMLSSAGSS